MYTKIKYQIRYNAEAKCYDLWKITEQDSICISLFDTEDQARDALKEILKKPSRVVYEVEV